MKVTTPKLNSKRRELVHRIELSDREAFSVANALQTQMMHAITARDNASDKDVRHAFHVQAKHCAELCAHLYRACGYKAETIQSAILPEEFSTFA